MIQSNISSMSSVKAKVDIYNGDTLVKTCTCSDIEGATLENFKITRAGDSSKFFGFGIVHKIDANFIDFDRELTITKENSLKVGYVVGNETIYPYPTFYVTEVNRDEKTNTISCTAYDGLYRSATGDYDSLNINPPYTVKGLAEACARSLGYVAVCPSLTDGSFDVLHEEKPNYEGTELISDVLVDIAEVTQTIYYLDAAERLIFKRLDKTGNPVFTINKDKYYELETMTARKLDNICSTNELGDNLGDIEGIVQYVRDNPLWVLRTDRAELVRIATESLKDLTITQFNCDWEGNFLLEIGDKIALTTQNNDNVSTYLLNDILEYNGVLSELTEWEYTADEGETASNPTNLGEKLNQTFAKVDKIAKEITLQVGDIVDAKLEDALGNVLDETTTKITQLELTTESLNASVQNITTKDANQDEQISQLQLDAESIALTVSENKTATDNSLDTLNERITAVGQEASLKVTSGEVEIIVQQTLSEGVEKVVTASKQYSFTDEGLLISSSDSNIGTEITQDGMTITRAGSEVLVANNEGVMAEDLHATTYLIIGETSRLEDKDGRTACFWIKED